MRKCDAPANGDAPAKGKVKAPKAPKVKAPKVRQVRQNQAATPRLKPKNSHADSPDDTATSLKGLTRIVSKLLESAGETKYPDILSAASSHVQPAESEAKNLRRRVYDILSVLASTGLVGRRGRGLVWNGYPDEGTIASLLLPRDPVLEREKAELLGRIKEKREQIRRAHEAGELLRGLAERNARLEASGAQLGPDEMAKVPLPFVLLACERGTEIAVETAENTHEILFKFTSAFTLHDDFETLGLMHLPKPTVHPNASEQFELDDELVRLLGSLVGDGGEFGGTETEDGSAFEVGEGDGMSLDELQAPEQGVWDEGM